MESFFMKKKVLIAAFISLAFKLSCNTFAEEVD